MPAVAKLVVVGVGLIGGSFALALKGAGAVGEVVGVGRGQSNLDAALRLGIVDRALNIDGPWTAELHDAALVLVATPVGQMAALFTAMASQLGPRTIVTDAGSTKQDVVAAASAAFGSSLSRFVPGHPIAGAEQTGAAAALAGLFQGRAVVLTPTAATDRAAVDLVATSWKRCGALVRTLDAARHDEIFAAVSHLPHALAFALVAQLAERPDAPDYFEHAASGFRDFTRLASSSPEMWRDIVLANARAMRHEIAAYRRVLDRLDASIAAGDRNGVLTLFEQAHDARERWLAREGNGA